MSLLAFLDQLAAADGTAQPTARRGAVAQLGRTAAAALPALLTAVATTTPAAAQRSGTNLDALQLALRVEWLQDEFYGRVLGAIAVSPPVSPSLVPGTIQPDLALIRAQQRQHITLLEGYIRASAGIIGPRPRYDFTASGNGARTPLFPDVFTNTDTMLVVAQLIEDLSVRTYTRQTFLLGNNNDLLDATVRMFAVEGRHAAHVRQLRRQRGATVKNWVSGNEGGGPLGNATAAFYVDEARVLQQVSVSDVRDVSSLLPATIGLSDADKLAAASEAFDEPLPAYYPLAQPTDPRLFVTTEDLLAVFTF